MLVPIYIKGEIIMTESESIQPAINQNDRKVVYGVTKTHATAARIELTQAVKSLAINTAMGSCAATVVAADATSAVAAWVKQHSNNTAVRVANWVISKQAK